MINTMFPQAARTAQRTAMPICMPVSGATYGFGIGTAGGAGILAPVTGVLAVRDRHVAGVTLAQGAVPGPSAWSPPS